jgi:hypothetical protein
MIPTWLIVLVVLYFIAYAAVLLWLGLKAFAKILDLYFFDEIKDYINNRRYIKNIRRRYTNEFFKGLEYEHDGNGICNLTGHGDEEVLHQAQR